MTAESYNRRMQRERFADEWFKRTSRLLRSAGKKSHERMIEDNDLRSTLKIFASENLLDQEVIMYYGKRLAARAARTHILSGITDENFAKAAAALAAYKDIIGDQAVQELVAKLKKIGIFAAWQTVQKVIVYVQKDLICNRDASLSLATLQNNLTFLYQQKLAGILPAYISGTKVIELIEQMPNLHTVNRLNQSITMARMILIRHPKGSDSDARIKEVNDYFALRAHTDPNIRPLPREFLLAFEKLITPAMRDGIITTVRLAEPSFVQVARKDPPRDSPQETPQP